MQRRVTRKTRSNQLAAQGTHRAPSIPRTLRNGGGISFCTFRDSISPYGTPPILSDHNGTNAGFSHSQPSPWVPCSAFRPLHLLRHPSGLALRQPAGS
jgi:hypothetical protein